MGSDPVERALPPEVREALPLLEEVLGIPRGRWHLVASLRHVLEAAAASSLAAELEEDGLSRTAAVEEAELFLGISPGTVARRLRRWRREVLP